LNTINAINEDTKHTTREVSAVDRHLTDGIFQLSTGNLQSTGKVVDVVGAQTLGLRDAIERNALNVSNNVSSARQDAAASFRDAQVSIERTGLGGMNTTERVGSNVMSAIERTSGEAKLTGVIADAATRQATNDLARDIISNSSKGSTDILSAISEGRLSSAISDSALRQYLAQNTEAIVGSVNRGTNELLVSTERNGNDTRAAVNTNGYETRTLVNQRATESVIESSRTREALAMQGSTQYASLLIEQQKNMESLARQASNNFSTGMLETQKVAERLGSQSSAQYASMLLEQQKVKEHMSVQMAEAKYEALKNKEVLAAQIAASTAEGKYEALKNTQTLSAQLAECCCEIKSKVCDVSAKVDDTVRTLDTNRVRDALGVANNEINLLKVLEHRGGLGYGGLGWGHRGHHGHGDGDDYRNNGPSFHYVTEYRDSRDRRGRRSRSRSHSRERDGGRGGDGR
jgi:hypothetical protein